MSGIDTTEAPLAGTVVLDVTLALAGPLTSMLLTGLGATVIKIERPDGGDLSRTNPPYLGEHGINLHRRSDADLALPFINRNRGKLSVALDLKTTAGVEIFMDLARAADVVMENNSVGAMRRLGLDYAPVSAVNPGIVYCSLTGFGSAAGALDTRAFDLSIQALSGVMSVTGEDGAAPVRLGMSVADILAGTMGVIGILAALRERDRSGRGQHVDVSMLDVTTSMVALEHFDALEECGIPLRTGNSLARMAPFGIYPTATQYVAICAPTDASMTALARLMDQSEVLEDPRFASRSARTENRLDLDAIIEAWTRSLSAEEVAAGLTAAGVPAAVVREPREALHDQRVLSRGAVSPIHHPDYGVTADVIGTDVPIQFSRSMASLGERQAPRLGQHSRHVLRDILGYEESRIDALASEGVIQPTSGDGSGTVAE